MYRPLGLPSPTLLTQHWSQMQRRLVATFERAVGAGRMTNASADTIQRGETVTIGGSDRTFARAKAGDIVAGVASSTTEPSGRTSVASTGEQTVLLLAGESPAVGKPVWQSGTPGRATCVPQPSAFIGVIVSRSSYPDDTTVRAILCCPQDTS